MILHMIQLDPKERLSCGGYLQKYESVVFPIYFSEFLHKFFSDIVPLDSDARVRIIEVCDNHCLLLFITIAVEIYFFFRLRRFKKISKLYVA